MTSNILGRVGSDSLAAEPTAADCPEFWQAAISAKLSRSESLYVMFLIE
jgi:hypothetical protein